MSELSDFSPHMPEHLKKRLVEIRQAPLDADFILQVCYLTRT